MSLPKSDVTGDRDTPLPWEGEGLLEDPGPGKNQDSAPSFLSTR